MSKLLDKHLSEKAQDRIYYFIQMGLCALLYIFVLSALGSAVVRAPGAGNFKLTPFKLMGSRTIDDIALWGAYGYGTLVLSYWVSKIYYSLFLAAAGITLFIAVFRFVANKKDLYRHISNVMFTLLIFLFVSMLIGMNYVNIYKTIDSDLSVRTPAPAFFILGVIIYSLKFTADIIFGKRFRADELKESSITVATSCVLTFVALGTLFAPLYIFPGTPLRLKGWDILTGKPDVLSPLPMSSIYKGIIVLFTILILASFIVNIVLFLIRRKVFIHYNKYHNIFGWLYIVMYALMGANYLIVVFDSGAYNQIDIGYLVTSVNTYSYVPLALLLMYYLGVLFMKMATSKLNIEYKVYAKPGDRGQRAAAAAPAGGALEDASAADPIPAFSELDMRVPQFAEEYDKRAAHPFTDLTLPKLVNHVIDYAKHSKERLSYGPVEIKTFVAGLAASKLSILQGLSGTGKTSLPKIFMEAVDGICDLVAVESSWRDKNELLGYYNEFNKKYTPKSFIQFLYKAGLNRDVPCFIVLDEMNLSRIEYYFSDFLSLMESRENARFIKLFDVQLYPDIDDRTDYLCLRDGHTIDIPANVWFVGTANRDESTFEISDKVYDRAQTMNFDKRAPKVNVVDPGNYPQKFVSYTQLRGLFETASRAMAFDAENCDAIKKVERLLRPYKITFGNRILNQIEEFVKAYVACSEIQTRADRGRFIDEAIDCIVFSKVVRKLELKQVTDIDALIEEFSHLKLPKCEEFLRSLTEQQ